MTSFKEQLKDEITEIFLNLEEFAEEYTIRTSWGEIQQVSGVLDKDLTEQMTRIYKDSYADGIYSADAVFYCEQLNFSEIPSVNSRLIINAEEYYVRSVANESGMLILTLEANRS